MNYDIYELARYLAFNDAPEEFYEDDEDDIFENYIYERYGCDIEQFEELINYLLPLCAVGKSPLTDKLYQGFGTGNLWLIKKEV